MEQGKPFCIISSALWAGPAEMSPQRDGTFGDIQVGQDWLLDLFVVHSLWPGSLPPEQVQQCVVRIL